MLKKHIKIICSVTILSILVLVSFNCQADTTVEYAPIVGDIPIIEDAPIVALMPQLIDEPIFKENEQSLVIIHPRFNDGITNIIFYALYCDEECSYGYTAETIGHGDLPFSDYYAPAPGIGKYIAVEYFNDNGNFGCTGISFNDCIADPHFVSQESFEVVDNNAIIPVSVVVSPPVFDEEIIPVQSIETTLPMSTPEEMPLQEPASAPFIFEATSSPVSVAEISTSSESIIGAVIDAFSNILGL